MGREFREVVISDHGDFIRVVERETPQVFETRSALRIVVGSLGGKTRDGMIVRRQFDSQVVGIPDVQQPPVLALDRHAAMTERVAEQGNQQHFGGEADVDRTSFHPEPLPDGTARSLPLGTVSELFRNIPPMAARDVDMLLLGDMDMSIREVCQTAGVVRVAMGQEDVPHISRRKADRFDPTNGRIRLVELKPRQIDEGLPQSPDGIANILKADAGIYEREPFAIP